MRSPKVPIRPPVSQITAGGDRGEAVTRTARPGPQNRAAQARGHAGRSPKEETPAMTPDSPFLPQPAPGPAAAGAAGGC